MFILSLQLMLYGLAGVFVSLAILYIAVCAAVKIFPYNQEGEE